jgi:hypothetical protein
MAATEFFPKAFKALAVFLQQPANSNGGGTVTRLCDMPPAKNYLPAVVCAYTLPNKVVVQLQPRENPR